MIELLPRPAWHDKASCVGLWGLFFLERGSNVDDEAIAICVECPVRIDCLEHALEKRELAGIWGGFTEKGRRPLRRRWRAGVRGVALLEDVA